MRVTHPILSHIHYDVPDEKVDRWIASGWIADLPDPEPDIEQSWKDANASFKSTKKIDSSPLEGDNGR